MDRQNNLWQEHQVQIKMFEALLKKKEVPHALLFFGAWGIGKTAFAKKLAQALLCEKKSFTVCKTCFGCICAEKIESFNFFSLKATGDKQKRIKIEQIRALQKKMLIPFSGSRVCLIEEAELMTKEAGNAFLKILEEPLADTFFILLSEHKEKIMPTILSRLMAIHFKVLSKKTIHAILKKQNITELLAKTAVQFAEGGLKKAEQFLEDEKNNGRKAVQTFLQKLAEGKLNDLFLTEFVFAWGEVQKKEGYETIQRRLNYLLYFFRDFLVLKAKANENLIYNVDLFKENNVLKNMSHGWVKTAILLACKRTLKALDDFKISTNSTLFLYTVFSDIINIYQGRLLCKK